MPAAVLSDFSRLCIHTITTKPWPLAMAAQKYAAAGIGGITIWRDAANAHPGGIKEAGKLCREQGLEIVSYVRGGFFASTTDGGRRAAIDDNKRIIDEAGELGAPLIVLVCGAAPGQSLETSREQIAEGIAAVAGHAAAAGIRLGIEPLHPMYAGSRSAINTLEQANDISLRLGFDNVGVTLDVFHVWWEPRLASEIRRCAENGKLFSFHICDWKDEPEDFLNDRGLMGEGCIDVRHIRGLVEDAGFTGFNEVEIFSNRYWAMNQDDYLAHIQEAYLKHS
jgi:sugar phosphate isomerase/epimerase